MDERSVFCPVLLTTLMRNRGTPPVVSRVHCPMDICAQLGVGVTVGVRVRVGVGLAVGVGVGRI